VALDAVGNVYIGDQYYSVVRKALFYASYPNFTVSDVGPTNAGNYSVVISNSYGCVTSALATLTVEAPPIITVQPASLMVLPGVSPVFNVTAAGSGPFEYLCYYEVTNLLQSATSGTLTIPGFASANAGSYMVVVTNAYGSVTSQVVTLTAVYAPSVTAPPASQTVLPGPNVTFNVAAGGTGPFTYQWQLNGNNLPNNTITMVAGNGTNGYTGDGGSATQAGLNGPVGVALDASGKLYIADEDSQRIRTVDTNGIISTFAGNGTNGFSGDGGAATNASMAYPCAVALDANGNLYFTDSGNNRIRKVNTNGIITTVAGSGIGGYYPGCYWGDGGPAAYASFYAPFGVALDASGNLYIADDYNGCVRKVDTNGIITKVAGRGSDPSDSGVATNAVLHAPMGVAVDASGNLYISDNQTSRLLEVGTNGIMTKLVGGVSMPEGLAVDAFGNLFVADTSNNRIRKVDTNGVITTVAGGGSGGAFGAATNTTLKWPGGVAVDSSGNLYIADTYDNLVREVYLAGFPALTLSNISATNAGSYSVVVSSLYGSVTSAVATLTVQAPPVITVQPTNQTVLAGSSPSFSVVAAGSGPFGYSWSLAGSNLDPTDTNSTLTLPCVFTNNAGSYTVVVTNAYGSVTSAVAALTVTIPTNAPQIMTGDGFMGFLTNQFGFNLSGAFGQTVVVDGSTDLVTWTPLSTNTCGSASPFYFCDPCWTNYPFRFYRARLP
jgi:sugar lactone lactonase YvrE